MNDVSHIAYLLGHEQDLSRKCSAWTLKDRVKCGTLVGEVGIN